MLQSLNDEMNNESPSPRMLDNIYAVICYEYTYICVYDMPRNILRYSDTAKDHIQIVLINSHTCMVSVSVGIPNAFAAATVDGQTPARL